MLTACLAKHPKDRPSARQLLDFECFKDEATVRSAKFSSERGLEKDKYRQYLYQHAMD